MTRLKTKIEALLTNIAQILEPIDIHSQKWILTGKSTMSLINIRDDSQSLASAYINNLKEISKLKSYSEAKQAFECDPVFTQALKSAGYYGTFEGALQHLIISSGCIRRNRVIIKMPKAHENLSKLRHNFTQNIFNYNASIRILGLQMRCKEIHITDHTSLYRLSRRECNELQPIIDNSFTYGHHDHQIAFHPVEARTSLKVNVDHSKASSIFNANFEAQRIAYDKLSIILNTLFLSSSGNIKFGPLRLVGGIEHMPFGRSLILEPILGERMIISKKDTERLKTAYNILSESAIADQVIKRSFHRFMLGRQRYDVKERLIDFVIAWEAILLTIKDNQNHSELSYRFAMNGAAICHATGCVNKKTAFNEMKIAYSLRSTIVHGGDDKTLTKKLQPSNFSNIKELCDTLEIYYRKVIFWLAKLTLNQRPYSKDNGWEELIWS